jgi:hypothetical protein
LTTCAARSPCSKPDAGSSATRCSCWSGVDLAWHHRGSIHGLFNGLHHPRRGDRGALHGDLHCLGGRGGRRADRRPRTPADRGDARRGSARVHRLGGRHAPRRHLFHAPHLRGRSAHGLPDGPRGGRHGASGPGDRAAADRPRSRCAPARGRGYRRDLWRSGLLWPRRVQARLGGRPARAATAQPAAGLDRPVPDRRAADACCAAPRAASPPSTTPRSGRPMVRDYSAFLPGAAPATPRAHGAGTPRLGSRPSPARSTPMR